jgi:hypothetical protein
MTLLSFCAQVYRNDLIYTQLAHSHVCWFFYTFYDFHNEYIIKTTTDGTLPRPKPLGLYPMQSQGSEHYKAAGPNIS